MLGNFTCEEPRKALNHYIYDYLLKSSFERAASGLLLDAKFNCQEVEPLLKFEDSLLLEWFELFYSISGTLGRKSFQNPKLREYVAGLANSTSDFETPDLVKEKHQFQEGPLRLPSMLCQRFKRQNISEQKVASDPKVNKTSKSPRLVRTENMKAFPTKVNTRQSSSKPKKSPPRALNRSAAPTSISLPPNTLSTVSWPKDGPLAGANSGPLMAESLNCPASASLDNFVNNIAQSGVRPNLQIPAPNLLNSSQRFVAQQHAIQRHHLKKNNIQRQNTITHPFLAPAGPRPLLPNTNPRGEPAVGLSTGLPVQFPSLEAQFQAQSAMPAAAFLNFSVPQPAFVPTAPVITTGDDINTFFEKYMNDSMFLSNYEAALEAGPFGANFDDQILTLNNYMPLE